jgi:hypothetical protein
MAGTCSSCRTGLSAPSSADALCAESAHGSRHRSTSVLEVPGASRATECCKHQSSSRDPDGRAAPCGQIG